MKRIVKGEKVIPLVRFPYNRAELLNNPELLKQFMFVPLDPTLTDDDHCMVFDLDGFVEWFPEWNAMYREDDNEDWYKDSEGLQYLIDSIDRTVDVVKGVIE